MSVHRMPNGRWRARLKNGRVEVANRMFDTRREAVAWLAREKAALAGGVDPRAGRQRVRELLVTWLEIRRTTVARKTYVSDHQLHRLVPTSLQNLQVGQVTGREVARSFDTLIAVGLAESSVRRYRSSLSAFFGWCVREKIILDNPVLGVRVPRSSEETREMTPFTEAELEAAYAQWAAHDQRLADILLLLGWTGLRWSEARALRVEDFMELPTPGLMVRRSAPEGVGVKATKSRRTRRVPLANRVLPLVQAMLTDKSPGDLLLTTSRGAQLHRSAVLRSVKWENTGGSRRVHDLRHTAACLWLARGVDPGTVQAWMGHESIATTNRYLHFLGSGAHETGLDRLNRAPFERREGTWGAGNGSEDGSQR